MKNHDRLHAFFVRHTPRSRRRVHRVSIHKTWLNLSVVVTLAVGCVALYGLYALVWLPTVAAKLETENEILRRENEVHRQQLNTIVERIEAVEDTSRRIAEVSGVEEVVGSDAPRGAGGPALPLDAIDEVETSTAISFIAHRAADLEQEILTFEAIMRERSRTPSALPTQGVVTDSYGVRSNPFGGAEAEFHAGLDIAAPSGAPVVATGTGIVTFAGMQSGYGNVVMIDHGNGYQTRYAHLSQINTATGANITRGDIIGRVGSTGRSTGPHLHYEVRLADRPLNPRRFLPAKN